MADRFSWGETQSSGLPGGFNVWDLGGAALPILGGLVFGAGAGPIAQLLGGSMDWLQASGLERDRQAREDFSVSLLMSLMDAVPNFNYGGVSLGATPNIMSPELLDQMANLAGVPVAYGVPDQPAQPVGSEGTDLSTIPGMMYDESMNQLLAAMGLTPGSSQAQMLYDYLGQSPSLAYDPTQINADIAALEEEFRQAGITAGGEYRYAQQGLEGRRERALEEMTAAMMGGVGDLRGDLLELGSTLGLLELGDPQEAYSSTMERGTQRALASERGVMAGADPMFRSRLGLGYDPFETGAYEEATQRGMETRLSGLQEAEYQAGEAERTTTAENAALRQQALADEEAFNAGILQNIGDLYEQGLVQRGGIESDYRQGYTDLYGTWRGELGNIRGTYLPERAGLQEAREGFVQTGQTLEGERVANAQAALAAMPAEAQEMAMAKLDEVSRMVELGMLPYSALAHIVQLIAATYGEFDPIIMSYSGLTEQAIQNYGDQNPRI